MSCTCQKGERTTDKKVMQVCCAGDRGQTESQGSGKPNKQTLEAFESLYLSLGSPHVFLCNRHGRVTTKA